MGLVKKGYLKEVVHRQPIDKLGVTDQEPDKVKVEANVNENKNPEPRTQKPKPNTPVKGK